MDARVIGRRVRTVLLCALLGAAYLPSTTAFG